MEKKMVLIGSFFSACILILVSLSSVVSINTIEQSNNPSTPLFNTRISMAIQSEPTTSLSTSYLGKDVINEVWFPKTTHTGLLLQKAQLIVKDLQNYLRSIKDVHSLSDTEIVSLIVSYLKTQQMFSNVNEGYLHVLLSQHLNFIQKRILDEFSGPVVGVTFEICEGWYLLFLLICVGILLFLELVLPTTNLKCGFPD